MKPRQPYSREYYELNLACERDLGRCDETKLQEVIERSERDCEKYQAMVETDLPRADALRGSPEKLQAYRQLCHDECLAVRDVCVQLLAGLRSQAISSVQAQGQPRLVQTSPEPAVKRQVHRHPGSS